MKRLLISLLGALAFTAAAQTAPQTTPVTDMPTDAQTEAVNKSEIDDAYCLRHTGSRVIQRTDNRKTRTCANAIGRAYNRDDLDRTGEINIADALRKLDPAVH